MPSQIYIVSRGGNSLETALHRGFTATRSKSLGLAVAYISVYGAQFVRQLRHASKIGQIRLIADTRDAVSHPQAFRLALDDGWKVRVVNERSGTFHPKMYVAGERFAADGTVVNSTLYVIGSNNLTRSGLNNNVECCVVTRSDEPLVAAGGAFKHFWSLGMDLDDPALERYEEYFARRNRLRSLDDIEALGVADESLGPSPRVGRERPTSETITTRVATTTWAGLRSSTGGYRFQIEFPKRPGQVFARIVADAGRGRRILVLCEDGHVREMSYDYYQNAMYRLNVPNDVPGVAEARELHEGIGLIEKIDSERAPFRFKIVRVPNEIDEIAGRSRALGTLGHTPTRMYGWF